MNGERFVWNLVYLLVALVVIIVILRLLGGTGMNKEPLLTVGGIVAVVSAVLVFLKSFGVPITEDQQDAIQNLVAVLAPVVLAFVARQFVYAPESVEKIQGDAYRAGVPPTDPKPEVPPPGKA